MSNYTVINTDPIFKGRSEKEQSMLAWTLRVRDNKVLGRRNTIAYSPDSQARFFSGAPRLRALWQELVDNELLPVYKDLQGVDLSGCDFSNLDLCGFDLTGANLTKARLSESILVGVKLAGANLSEAHAWRANFSQADMTSTNFTKAYLKESKFCGAQLTRAKLDEADLRKANMDRAWLRCTSAFGARLEETSFRDACAEGIDLRKARATKDVWLELKRAKKRGIEGEDSDQLFARILTEAVRAL